MWPLKPLQLVAFVNSHVFISLLKTISKILLMGYVCQCQGREEIRGRIGLTVGVIFELEGRKELWDMVGWAVGEKSAKQILAAFGKKEKSTEQRRGPGDLTREAP